APLLGRLLEADLLIDPQRAALAAGVAEGNLNVALVIVLARVWPSVVLERRGCRAANASCVIARRVAAFPRAGPVIPQPPIRRAGHDAVKMICRQLPQPRQRVALEDLDGHGAAPGGVARPRC